MINIQRERQKIPAEMSVNFYQTARCPIPPPKKKQYCVYCTCCIIRYSVHEEHKCNFIFFMNADFLIRITCSFIHVTVTRSYSDNYLPVCWQSGRKPFSRCKSFTQPFIATALITLSLIHSSTHFNFRVIFTVTNNHISVFCSAEPWQTDTI